VGKTDMTKKTSTTIAINRLDAALSGMGIRLKRTQLLNGVAAAFGHRNVHELAAADASGALRPPEARPMGRARVPRIGMMLFLQDPDGTVFAVDEDRFDAQTGQAGDWILSPLGGLLDVSALRNANAAAHEETQREGAIVPDDATRLEADACGAVGDDAVRHLAIRSQLNRAIYQAVRDYRMGNMCEEDDHLTAYPLVDLMSNPAPASIATGEMEMISLVDEIEMAVRRTLGLPDETVEAPARVGDARPEPRASRAAIGAHVDHFQTPEACYRDAPLDPLQPAYMTNGCCEPASVTQDDLDSLGLPHGSWEGDFYPLTDREAAYIAEDEVKSDDGLHEALIGYSVLYRGAKHVMPTIEIAHATDRDDGFVFPPRDDVLADATAYADRIRGKVEELGGAVLIDEEYDDRILVQILVPFTSVQEVGDFEAWKELLAWLMVDPDLPTVMRDEIVLTGAEHRVSVSWQQEGRDGDYDPEERYDQPLLRVDVDELRGGEWIEARDATFCSQIPAYAPRDTIRQFAEMVLDTLNREGAARRTCERMGQIEPHHVAAWSKARKVAGADDYVAHVTYGNPDRGTSIDLRRRADGSVRCEIYVDLDCAALFDEGDMADVRAWLTTLPSDAESADGPNQPSFALAPTWTDFEAAGEEGVSWRLVPEDESETDWFAEVPPCAPFEKRFVTIAEMDV
jgi:hypothetical protein